MRRCVEKVFRRTSTRKYGTIVKCEVIQRSRILKNTNPLIQKVSELFRWIEEQIQTPPSEIKNSCNTCGNCCDFDAYGHRLYITPPERIYLVEQIGEENIKPMTTGRCPYQVDNKCSIHPHRFASCRIFFCRGDKTMQSDLSEETLKRLKAICDEFGIPYRYTDIKTTLNGSIQRREEI
jgi:Fe-S-cluster containining protein